MAATPPGVWLDRGELDKVIERSNAAAPAPLHAAPAPPPQQPWGAQPGYPPQQPGGYGHGRYQHGKRKKSFLEELFD